MNPEEFRKLGHQLVDWVADYRADAPARPITTKAQPGSIKAGLPASPPQQAESLDNLLGDIERLIMPGISHWQHPRFFAYFPSNSLLAGVLGDYLATGLGVLGLSWQSSPALTELEEVATDWLRQMLGLGDAWQGVIQDTASSATLIALLCARERATDHGAARGGLQAEAQPLIVYGSAQSHSSVDKAALLAGFGRDNIRHVATDAAYALRPDALRAAIAADLKAGLKPCAIVATVGTTATTAIDPVAEIASIAQEFGLWLHVDAAMAGSAMILPECRPLWDGIEGADSLVTNAHKWLGVSFDCSLYYIRDAEHLIRVMSTNPSYLQSGADGSVKNFRDWGLPLGRRFRALKLWLTIREQGVAGLQARLRRDLAQAQWLTKEIGNTPGWRVLAPVPLQTICVRHEPAGLSGEALDRHTLSWAEKLNLSGEAYVTPAQLDGRWMVRLSLGAHLTEQEDVAALWRAARAAAEG